MFADPKYISACVSAGRQLAERLQHFRGSRALVLSMMPSGQLIAQEIARVLRLPQEILVARELHVQPYPDVAAGGISEGSGLCINRAALRLPGMSPLAIWAEAYIVRDQVELLVQQYRAGRPLPTCNRRSVILVDDRLGAGLAQLAALQVLRRLHPAMHCRGTRRRRSGAAASYTISRSGDRARNRRGISCLIYPLPTWDCG